MRGSGKFFGGIFARASLGFVLAASVVPLRLFAAESAAAAATASVKRQAASTQFTKAEEQRATLNSKPPEKRSLSDYKQVVSTYRRVYLITPRAQEVSDSLLAIAELYTEMGDRFGRSYYQSAVDSYKFLLEQYPTSRYCQDALLRSAKLQKDQLGDSAAAEKTYEAFLKKYPRSPRKREAQESLAELALLKNSAEPAVAQNAAPAPANEAPAPTREFARAESSKNSSPDSQDNSDRTENSGIPRIRRIRAAANGDATRITIDLESSVQYSSARIANPDRIFFDLHAARLTPELAKANIHVEGNLLTAVRVAQNHNGVVRVVLDVNGVKDYTASLSHHPTQLLIDLYGTVAPATVQTAKAKRNQWPVADVDAENDSHDDSAAAKNPPSETASIPPAPATSRTTSAKNGAKNAPEQNDSAAANDTTGANASAAAPRNGTLVPKSVRAKNVKGSSTKPDLVRPASAPEPTHDGQSTLTRALGLKIGRIVIDPGHGGHDTGTIGPTGLMEKDLCLDVALRLGKIIQQRLPGADVIYTRSDDTFIPLEERTNIANEAKADLFISIHANSSHDHLARGIETYYLNLKGTPEAMEVAARENAVSQEGIHNLEDLVKKIARSEKIDESKEFAEDIQNSLAQRIQKTAKPVKNRGVRKAPFVVLIGADMPSILTEISFLSNPADEQLLKKPEHRQRVAEGLYQGVASYLQSMNSVTLNSSPINPSKRSTSIPVEESRNQK
jgi:N-acetylmuramoyl-L-alanine amidase